MTGPECYQEALRLRDPANSRAYATRADMLAEAQVLATLALAAATALGHWTPDGTLPQPDRMDWWRTASGDPAERKRIKDADPDGAAEFEEAQR